MFSNVGRPQCIYLARHGQSLANMNKQISGQLDSRLSPKGLLQAQWLKEVLLDETVTAVFCSSLNRAIETARPTAESRGLPIQIKADLREIYLGDLQGRKVSETNEQTNRLWQNKSLNNGAGAIADGETFQAFQYRVCKCLAELLENFTGTALIVAHRNTNKLILNSLLTVETKLHPAINVKNKYVYEITLGDTPLVNTIRLGGERHGQKYSGLKYD